MKCTSPPPPSSALPKLSSSFSTARTAGRSCCGPAGARLTIALYWPLDHRTTLLGDRLYNFYSILQQEQEPADPYELLIQTYFSGRLGEMLSPILQGRYDGVIIGGAGEQDLIQLENADISTPLVLINAESRKYSTAGVNHAQTGSQAAALIHQKGYRECAVIRGGDHYDGTSQRTKAFLNSCRQLGIRIQPEWTFQAAPTIAGGAAATEEYCVLRQRPRVIYYENDSMAQGGLYTLARSGIRVPQDTEVLCIGLRKPEMNHCLNPALSCITIPQTVDRQAVALLLRLIRELPAAPLHVEMEPQVQLRESFTPPENAPADSQ